MRRLSGYKPFCFCCLTFGSAAEHSLPSAAGGSRNLFPSLLCPPSLKTHWSPPSGWSVDLHHLFFSSAIPSYVGTSTNELRPLPLSSPNEEWWITAGLFVLVHGPPHWSFRLAEDVMVPTSPTCPRLGGQQMICLHPLRWLLVGSCMAQRQPGCRATVLGN